MANPFPETRWTLIQRARQEDADPAALEEWCRNYWPPVYSYICAQGHDGEAAREFTQGFFENLMVRGPDACLPDRLHGAFRAYLMRSVKNYLTDQWRAAQSQRQGRGSHPACRVGWHDGPEFPGGLASVPHSIPDLDRG